MGDLRRYSGFDSWRIHDARLFRSGEDKMKCSLQGEVAQKLLDCNGVVGFQEVQGGYDVLQMMFFERSRGAWVRASAASHAKGGVASILPKSCLQMEYTLTA